METPADQAPHLTLARYMSVQPLRCPCCQELIPGAGYGDGDSVDFQGDDPDDLKFNLVILYGKCPLCQGRYISAEISQIAGTIGGGSFMNLHRNRFSSRTFYEITGTTYQWYVERYFDVTGLLFTAPHLKDGKPDSFYNKEPLPWLNVHDLGPFASSTCGHLFDFVRGIYREVKPLILAHDWGRGE